MHPLASSEENVTYLLGAGASAQALPTVQESRTNKGMYNALMDFAQTLEQDGKIRSDHKDFVAIISNDLRWVAEMSRKFATPDTFAKYLYLVDRKSLPRLKNALSFYFVTEQFVNHSVDSRPLVFLTSVLQRSNLLPWNINILSWNYDFQMQIAASSFVREQASLQVRRPGLFEYYPTIGYDHQLNSTNDRTKYSLIHLNGIAGSYAFEGRGIMHNLVINDPPRDINKLIDHWKSKREDAIDLLVFGWEESEATHFLRNSLQKAQEIAVLTNILVVIGYSFPFFNRKIDKEIFEALKNGGNLKTIYFQDPVRDGEFLRNQFSLPEAIEIRHIDSTESYFIPNEL